MHQRNTRPTSSVDSLRYARRTLTLMNFLPGRPSARAPKRFRLRIRYISRHASSRRGRTGSAGSRSQALHPTSAEDIAGPAGGGGGCLTRWSSCRTAWRLAASAAGQRPIGRCCSEDQNCWSRDEEAVWCSRSREGERTAYSCFRLRTIYEQNKTLLHAFVFPQVQIPCMPGKMATGN